MGWGGLGLGLRVLGFGAFNIGDGGGIVEVIVCWVLQIALVVLWCRFVGVYWLGFMA